MDEASELSQAVNDTLSQFNLKAEDIDLIMIVTSAYQTYIREADLLNYLKPFTNKPIVSIAVDLPFENVHYTVSDCYKAYDQVVEHLIKEHGCKNIGFISAAKTESKEAVVRLDAFQKALKNHNLEFNPDNVIEGYFIREASYNITLEKYKSKKDITFDALISANDLMAEGVMKALQQIGVKIPKDVKIIGFDDITEAKCTKPSITTVKNNAELLGAEAVSRLLCGVNGSQVLKVKSTPVFRQSCGCAYSTTTEQNLFTLNILDDANKKEEFDRHMEIIGEIFTEAADVFTLLTNIENFFVKSHPFEGSDFCIFMKSDWTSVLINSAENLPQNLSYGPQVQAICSVQTNQKYLREMIPTSELIPSKMKSEGSNMYLFLPVFHHSYVHGYFVTKNDLSMIDNRYGYMWSRNIGNGIEHFRKRNMFKQMSQQYLRLSTKDALSGCLNRQGLERLAKPFYAQNKKNGLTTVLFFVDINKMKHINDQFGHLHGDLAVKTVAAAVLETVPKNWLSIRYGGDEFLVVGNSKNYNGEDYCELIKKRLASKTSVMHLPYNLTVSVGTYSVPPQSELTLEQAVETVDNIMYEQKQAFHKEDDKK